MGLANCFVGAILRRENKSRKVYTTVVLSVKGADFQKRYICKGDILFYTIFNSWMGIIVTQIARVMGIRFFIMTQLRILIEPYSASNSISLRHYYFQIEMKSSVSNLSLNDERSPTLMRKLMKNGLLEDSA